MKMKSLSSAVLLGLAVLASSPGIAATTGLESANAIKKMDANRDGKLTKTEFLASMSAVFDRHAGAKGYCTPDEVEKVKKEMADLWGANQITQ